MTVLPQKIPTWVGSYVQIAIHEIVSVTCSKRQMLQLCGSKGSHLVRPTFGGLIGELLPMADGGFIWTPFLYIHWQVLLSRCASMCQSPSF